MTLRLLVGDCREHMAAMDEASVDAIVTDPPYGLEFMGKDWDHGIPGVHFWEPAYRVLKPGGHLLAFGGTRTFHRLTVAIEDAGFEIRDCLSWLYGSGFPKSHNLNGDRQGWGTSLKPSWEPIIMARKPLIGTVAANVERYGTGAINVDGCRIEGEPWKAHSATGLASVKFFTSGDAKVIQKEPHTAGRWPANLILDEDAAAMLDAQSGESRSGLGSTRGRGGTKYANGKGFANTLAETGQAIGFADTGGASRFFYTAKASRSERNKGLDGMPEVDQGQRYGSVQDARPHTPEGYEYPRKPASNHHPTVKPLDLMQWLVRLVTPPGGTVLDPFAGSGTTLIAADREGFHAIGIEQDPEYAEIAKRRCLGDAPMFAELVAD